MNYDTACKQDTYQNNDGKNIPVIIVSQKQLIRHPQFSKSIGGLIQLKPCFNTQEQVQNDRQNCKCQRQINRAEYQKFGRQENYFNLNNKSVSTKAIHQIDQNSNGSYIELQGYLEMIKEKQNEKQQKKGIFLSQIEEKIRKINEDYIKRRDTMLQNKNISPLKLRYQEPSYYGTNEKIHQRIKWESQERESQLRFSKYKLKLSTSVGHRTMGLNKLNMAQQ